MVTNSTETVEGNFLTFQGQFASLEDILARLEELNLEQSAFVFYTLESGERVLAFFQSGELNVVSNFTTEVNLSVENFSFSRFVRGGTGIEITATEEANTFVYNELGAADTIIGFDAEVDKLRLNSTIFGNITELSRTAVSSSTTTIEQSSNFLAFEGQFNRSTIQERLAELEIDRSVLVSYTTATGETVLAFYNGTEIQIVANFSSEVELTEENFIVRSSRVTLADDDETDDDETDDDGEDDDDEDDDDETDDDEDDDEDDDDDDDDEGDDNVVVIGSGGVVTGSEGSDTFVVNSVEEEETTIRNFNVEVDKLELNSSFFSSVNVQNFRSETVTESTTTIRNNSSLLVFEQEFVSVEAFIERLSQFNLGSRGVFASFVNSEGKTVLVFSRNSETRVVSNFSSEVNLSVENFRFSNVISTEGGGEVTCTNGVDKVAFNGLGATSTIIDFNIRQDILQFNSAAFANITNRQFSQQVVNQSTTNVGNASLLVFRQQQFASVEQFQARLEEINTRRNAFFASYTNTEGNTVLAFVQNNEVNVVANFSSQVNLRAQNFSFVSSVAAGDGNDIISGTPANDVLNGFEGNDTILGRGGNDILRGGTGNDSINGEGGDDRLAGNEGNDTVIGGSGNDLMFGVTGNDVMFGRAGNDHLLGGDGNDTLEGGTGSDRLNGNAGNDVLTGGAGLDRFIFNTNQTFTTQSVGRNEITDFSVEQGDLILLDTRTFTAITSENGIGFSVESEFEVVTNAGAARASDALIVYNSSNGSLYYNENGSAGGFGNGGQFATLTGTPELTSESFQIRAPEL